MIKENSLYGLTLYIHVCVVVAMGFLDRIVCACGTLRGTKVNKYVELYL